MSHDSIPAHEHRCRLCDPSLVLPTGPRLEGQYGVRFPGDGRTVYVFLDGEKLLRCFEVDVTLGKALCWSTEDGRCHICYRRKVMVRGVEVENESAACAHIIMGNLTVIRHKKVTT